MFKLEESLKVTTNPLYDYYVSIAILVNNARRGNVKKVKYHMTKIYVYFLFQKKFILLFSKKNIKHKEYCLD